MLKGKRTMRSNVTQVSDLRRIYLEAVARKETSARELRHRRASAGLLQVRPSACR